MKLRKTKIYHQILKTAEMPRALSNYHNLSKAQPANSAQLNQAALRLDLTFTQKSLQYLRFTKALGMPLKASLNRIKTTTSCCSK